MILEDSLPTSRHPLRPRGLLTMNAKQLSSYGGSLETAVTDLEHYRSSGSAVLVLCGGETWRRISTGCWRRRASRPPWI